MHRFVTIELSRIKDIIRNAVKDGSAHREDVIESVLKELASIDGLGASGNIILMTDSYKVSQWRQYPPGTNVIYSYFESRGGKWDHVCFFGLQYILKRYFEGMVVTKCKIEEAAGIFEKHFGDSSIFNRAGWEYILAKHGGRLPITIKAVPEGQCVPNHNVLVTIENTDPACFWLPNYLETLLVQLWYPCTVATSSREQKKTIHKWLNKTGCYSESSLLFKLHDFGFRGVSSVESAGLGGLAHLINFRGTDTLAAVELADKYYGCKMAGFSIPASEHSTITSWGREAEGDAYKNMLEQFPQGPVACVSDSWDVFEACRRYWGDEFRSIIEHRNGCLIVRPDSGDPAETVCKVLKILGGEEDPEIGFGKDVRLSSTGHKILPDYVRIIQGDGVDIESLEKILCAVAEAGWAAENLAFGSGGALLQKVNRDTLKFAFKCSYAEVSGVGRDVYKDPVTDPGKRSKKGRLILTSGPDDTLATVSSLPNNKDQLIEVFRDGNILKEWTLEEIRSRADISRY